MIKFQEENIITEIYDILRSQLLNFRARRFRLALVVRWKFESMKEKFLRSSLRTKLFFTRLIK
jgi:hypothetical protein